MGLNILLVNPNSVKNPPVIPIGLEYLITSLEKHGHRADILDLCFESSPLNKLDASLKEGSFDLIGFSIRNIDSAEYHNNEFFLPEIKELVKCAKKYTTPIVLGGSGFSAMPMEILDYLQADYGIFGPGEIVFMEFLDLWQRDMLTKSLYNGWKCDSDDELIHLRGERVDYSGYLSENGVAGFETHKGCENLCPYCIEANHRIWFRKISNIIDEIRHMVNRGIDHFHLCDSEFNADLRYSIEFCKALIKSNLSLRWTLYMKPYPYSEELFRLLRESNAYLITLSVDSDERIQSINKYSHDDLEEIIQLCNRYGIKLSIDLLTGYPYESNESSRKMLEFFRRHRPGRVGVSHAYRIYGNTELADIIRGDPSLQINLSRPIKKGEAFLEPLFYRQYEMQDIERLFDGDDLFTIAGLVSEVNYQKISSDD